MRFNLFETTNKKLISNIIINKTIISGISDFSKALTDLRDAFLESLSETRLITKIFKKMENMK